MRAEERSWRPFEGGSSIGQSGSEDGVILRDEEHELGARITLERDGRCAPYAITCGVYGWLVHTRFFSDLPMAEQAFESMKAGLVYILTLIPRADDPDLRSKVPFVSAAIHEFIERFP